jgi:hypothetical protein
MGDGTYQILVQCNRTQSISCRKEVCALVYHLKLLCMTNNKFNFRPAGTTSTREFGPMYLELVRTHTTKTFSWLLGNYTLVPHP